MNKWIKKTIFLSGLLCFGNVLADSNDSALADLHRGTLVLPCVYVLFDDGSTGQEPIAYDVRMNQRGGSSNWEVVDAFRVADPETECPNYQFPGETDGGLDNTPEEEADEEEASEEDAGEEEADEEEADEEEAGNCVPANEHANNCKNKK